MKRFMLGCLALGFAQLLPAQPVETPASAAKLWTLEDCITYAIENNISVKQYQLAQENQELTVETTKYSRLPSLSANLGQNFYFGRTPDRDGVYQDQTGSTSSVGVNTSVNLFNGFYINNKLKGDKLELQASMEDLNKAKEDLALMVTGYYLQVLFNKELVTIAQDQLDLNKEQVRQTDALVKGGKSTESELYDALAAQAAQEKTLTESTNNLQLALLDLAQALNKESIDGFDVLVPDLEQIVVYEKSRLWMPEEVYQKSVLERPGIKAAELRLKGSEQTVKMAKAAYYPSLNLGAGYSNSFYYNYKLAAGLSNASLADQWAQNGSENIGLSLSIPIFNRMATRNQVRSAQLNVRNQQLQLDQAKLTLNKEVQQAYYNAIAAHDTYLSAQKAVEAARLALDFEEQKYKAGRSNSYAFNQVRLRLGTARADEAQALYSFLFRAKILAFYNGVGLTSAISL